MYTGSIRRFLPYLTALLALPLFLAAAPQEEPAEPEAKPGPEQTLQVLSDPVAIFRRGGDDYQIGRQDLLEISVFDLDELDRTVRVSRDGSITLPLLGRLLVAGLTKSELETFIARMLADRYVRDPQVTVFVKEYESKKVAVSGAVRKPGTYEMLGEKTLLEMLSLAGGLDKDLGKEIIVFRQEDGGPAHRIAINLDRLIYEADPELNLTLAPGDIIYVPAVEMMRIFVGGSVESPDLYEVPRTEPITLLKAIILAGGTTERAAERKVKIIRTAPDGSRTTIPVDLRKVKRGKAEDPVLQERDLVLVPESFF